MPYKCNSMTEHLEFTETNIQIADQLMESMYNDGDWDCHICANQWIGIIHNWSGKEYED